MNVQATPETLQQCFPKQHAQTRTITTEEGVTIGITELPEHSELVQPLETQIKELDGSLIVAAQLTKGIDPKGEAGAKKLPLGALPWAVIAEASLGMGEGATKYGPHNWRESGGVEVMTYVEAAQRHMMAFILGEDIDPASGIHHITKAISSLMVMRDAQINGCATDNRPPPVDPAFLEQLQASWPEVREKALAAKQER